MLTYMILIGRMRSYGSDFQRYLEEVVINSHTIDPDVQTVVITISDVNLGKSVLF